MPLAVATHWVRPLGVDRGAIAPGTVTSGAIAEASIGPRHLAGGIDLSDGDAEPSSERQSLSLDGSVLGVDGGASVNLASALVAGPAGATGPAGEIGVWTATRTDGSADLAATCNDWTNASSARTSGVGLAGEIGAGWTRAGIRFSCAEAHPLNCLQSDSSLNIPDTGARVATGAEGVQGLPGLELRGLPRRARKRTSRTSRRSTDELSDPDLRHRHRRSRGAM